MKHLIIVVLLFCCIQVPSITMGSQQTPQGISPEAMEQIRKMLPPGVQLPPEMSSISPVTAMNSGSEGELGGIPQTQESSYTPLPSSSNSISPVGSGRTPEQRAAAVAAVNAELERMPYILPEKKDAPTEKAVLKIARDRNAVSRKKFGVVDLSAYSRYVTWPPRFDGLQPNKDKAMEYSLLVSSVTNYNSEPYFIMALASAVFSLDHQSTANANNFASAVVAGGERLHAGPNEVKKLSPYRREAESIFRYALAISMKDDIWTEESFTAILNLGNLYIDMWKLDEARSLFQVARKLKPFSWDAALGMAAYFHAIGQPDKALVILEDPILDKPVMLMVAKKAAKALEKSEGFAELPPDTPEEKFEEGIKAIIPEPITTAADFVAQLDQSERNKMRYFIEHLPPEGSFTAPKINKLIQYASIQAISSPHGQSALKDFMQMLQAYATASAMSTPIGQLKMLSRLGIDIVPGIDLDDVAKHPEKYANSKQKFKSKVNRSKLKADIQRLRQQVATAQRELATGKSTTLMSTAAQIDPFIAILQIDAEQYADPMNINIQKHNFVVHNRKTNLYNGFLHSVNKQRQQAVKEILEQAQTKIGELSAMKADEEAELEARRKASPDPESVEWKIKRHKIHEKYFNQFNTISEAAFGSATNVATTAYLIKIKPMVEAYYYDVIRHVGLISDPEVRDQKDSELRKNINSALVSALGTVGNAYGSIRYSDNWDCDCYLEELLREREAEQEARNEEETARIMRNKAAKVAFDSGEIPESTALWKKLDAYGADLNIPFIPFLSGRISCARTYVKFNTDVLPFPQIGKLFGSMTKSEFTGATKYDGGVNIGISQNFSGGSVSANIGVSGSVSTDGNWNVRDSSITPSTGLSVQVGSVGVSVGGQMTFGPNGEVRDSDFSAGISQDMKNGFGMSGKASFEASTKRGCSLTGKVTDSIMPSDAGGKDVDKSPWEKIGGPYGESFRERPVTDKFTKKEIWSGKFCFKAGGCEKKAQ